jgi:hypothetical protein
MGYTHYWYRHPENETPELYGRFAIDAMRIVQLAAITGTPVEADFTEGYIRVNGVGPDACEDFYWPSVAETTDLFDDGSAFEFTKTRLRPYDAVVTALLLRARVVYEQTGMTFASDGTWDARSYGEGNWTAGRDLYAVTFGQQYPAHLEPIEIP